MEKIPLKIQIRQYHCEKNGCVWVSLLPTLPKQCPKCHNRNWWKPRREHLPKKLRPPCSYEEIKSIEINQYTILPWLNDARGIRDPKLNLSRSLGIKRYAYHHQKKFYLEGTSKGLLVRRVA